MSRPWKLAVSLLIAIPIGAFAAGYLLTYHALGRDAAWAFVIGSLRGTRARPLTKRSFEPTTGRLQRGAYLVGVARCFSCHSETDPQTDLPRGNLGAGTVRELMFRVTYPNITPDAETGARTWTDDMLGRAIREGIGHDGRPLLPIMPYDAFQNLSDEDLAAIVVYLRSIPPVRHPLPKMQTPFPFKLALKGMPRPLPDSGPSPNTSNPVVAAEYLMQVGGCAGCHDAMDRDGRRLPYAGGQVVSDHGVKSAAAANLTPDPSGISYYDEAMFIRVMRTGHVGARELVAAMPWRYFRNFTDEDLKRIFAYLRDLRPIKHRVDNTEPPTYCKVCRHTHGGGAEN
jgi:hypothetical protein